MKEDNARVMLRKSIVVASLFLIAAAFSVEGAFAQEGRITGTVVDATTSEAIPGANVVVEETGTGAATNAQGEFRITGVSEGSYTLRASFVGYEQKTRSVQVQAGEATTVQFRLAPSDVQLDDVVVTALGIEREESGLGYAVEDVDGADLQRTDEGNFISSLAGKVAGAQINTASQMGGSARITIRGPGSLSGDNQPLIVVDGIPLDNSNFNETGQNTGSGGYDYGNAASDLDPSDIESISVLKGASAAALYGSRAADGVIEITTKGGQRSDDLGVTFQSSVSGTQLYGFPDYQNQYGGGASPNFFENSQGQLVADFGTDQSWGPPLDGREVRQWYSYDDVNGLEGQTTPWEAHPNNVENFYGLGTRWNTSLAFSQGGETFNYRASLKNKSIRGNSPESRQTQRNVSFNGSLDLSEKLSTSVSFNYTQEDTRGRPGSGYTNANGPWLQFNHFGQRQVDLSEGAPMQNIQRPDGTQRSWNWANSGLGTDAAPQTGDIIYANNPFWIRRRNYQNDETNRVYGKVEVSYDLTQNLTLRADARTDYQNFQRQERIAIGSVEQPQFEKDLRITQESNVRSLLQYGGNLTEQVTLDATGGINYRYSNQSRDFGQTEGGLAVRDLFTLENSVSRPQIVDYFQEQAILGVFADATFGYEDLVYLGGTIRNDWSSTLPDDQNRYLYPGVSASFVFSRLPAFEESTLLSFGKIRANWSEVGRDTDPYRLSFTYPLGTPYGSTQLQSLPNTLPNSDLKPEIKRGWEVGAQLQFFQNRIGLDLTYYSEETRDQILRVGGSRASGYESRVINAGTIANKGVEATLDVTAVRTQDLQWDVSANWALKNNEVVSLAEGVQSIPINSGDSSPPFGPQIVAREGEEYGTFFGPGFQRTDEGEKIVSDAGYYQTTGPKTLGSYLPDWTWGASTTLSYQGVTASVVVDGQKGGQIWSLSNLFGLYSGMFATSAQGNIRQLGALPDAVTEDGSPYYGAGGTEESPTSAAGTASAKNVFQTTFGNNEAHLYDATYIKLREINVSYDLPQQWLRRVPTVQGVTASIYGRNLATLLKYTPNFDPTSVARGSSNLQGIEAGQMPPRRTFGFRLQMNF